MTSEQKQTQGSKIRDWAIESLLICISILLAFALTNWGEQRTLNERTQSVMCNIRDEMTSNYQMLTNDYNPRHKAIIAYIEESIKIIKSEPGKANSLALVDRPIVVEHLKDTAWNLAIETGYLIHVDFKFATKIASVYDLQEESYKETIKRVINELFAKPSGDDPNGVTKREELLKQFWEWYWQEEFLISNYAEVLELSELSDMKCDVSTNPL